MGAERARDAAFRVPRRRAMAVAVGIGVLLAATLFALYLRGGGPLPWTRSSQSAPLAASSPDEVVVRTLRLAGFERSVVARDGGTVIVRLEIPDLASAADAELSWQTAVAVAVTAYPAADRLAIQLFADGAPMLEVRIPGPQARAAVRADDAAALRRAAEFAYLSESPS